MLEDIIKEKISADHLFYVSLKYTKTCDVIVNLLLRWKIMIDFSVDALLKHAKNKKKIARIPMTPRQRIDKIKEIFKKDQNIMKAIELYEMFRQIETLEKKRECEFRKNVNLKVIYQGQEININLDMLKEYAAILERFISSLKQFLSI